MIPFVTFQDLRKVLAALFLDGTETDGGFHEVDILSRANRHVDNSIDAQLQRRAVAVDRVLVRGESRNVQTLVCRTPVGRARLHTTRRQPGLRVQHQGGIGSVLVCA